MLRREKEIHGFYKRCSPPVFTFCRLSLGDEAEAERITADVFLAHIRDGQSLGQEYILPILLGMAVALIRARSSLQIEQSKACTSLDEAILQLPREQREAFILQRVLELDAKATYIATGLHEPEIRKLCFQALLKLRELLPGDFFKERVCQPFVADKVISALREMADLPGVTVSEVKGFGRGRGVGTGTQHGETEIFGLKKVKLEIVVPDDAVDRMIEAILRHAHTGNPGDGKVFISDVADVVHVRTGKRGDESV